MTPFNSYRPTFYFYQNPESVAQEFKQEMDWELDEDPRPPQIDHYATKHLKLRKKDDYNSLIQLSPEKSRVEGINLNEVLSDSEDESEHKSRASGKRPSIRIDKSAHSKSSFGDDPLAVSRRERRDFLVLKNELCEKYADDKIYQIPQEPEEEKAEEDKTEEEKRADRAEAKRRQELKDDEMLKTRLAKQKRDRMLKLQKMSEEDRVKAEKDAKAKANKEEEEKKKAFTTDHDGNKVFIVNLNKDKLPSTLFDVKKKVKEVIPGDTFYKPQKPGPVV